MTLWSYNSCKTFVASLTIKNPVAFLFYVFLRQKLWKSSHKNALSSRKRQKSYENYWLSKWYIQDGKKTLEIFMDFHRVRKNPQKVSFELSHQKYWSFSLFSISKIWICTLAPNHQNYPFESKRLMCFFLKGSSTTFRFSVFLSSRENLLFRLDRWRRSSYGDRGGSSAQSQYGTHAVGITLCFHAHCACL